MSSAKLCLALLPLSSLALHRLPAQSRIQGDPLTLPPRQWAADAATNELKVLQYGAPYLRYHMQIHDSKGEQVRDVLESRDGAVARLILKDGRPLTPDEDAAERSRLQDMLDSPAAFARHIHGDGPGKKNAAEIIAQVPDAMEFHYVPGQPQREHLPAGAPPEIVLDFEPNPQWHPRTMAAEGLAGLKGRAWIDPRTHVLTRMEGHIFQAVSVGLILAKVYPGGELTFEQAEVQPSRWIFTHFTSHLTIRALMVKTVKENADFQGVQHSLVPAMSYQEAIRTLLATPLPR